MRCVRHVDVREGSRPSGASERKYCASGVETFLGVHPDSGDISQLVSCNVDPKCSGL
jgi:hypothetical protein